MLANSSIDDEPIDEDEYALDDILKNSPSPYDRKLNLVQSVKSKNNFKKKEELVVVPNSFKNRK
jgi:hypothetical protein